jgi:hypothetical protein
MKRISDGVETQIMRLDRRIDGIEKSGKKKSAKKR